MKPPEAGMRRGEEKARAGAGAGVRPSGLGLLDLPVSSVPGVGPGLRSALAALGIESVGDLLTHFPRRYIDRSQIRPISALKEGEEPTVVATVRSAGRRALRGGRTLVEVVVGDGTGYLSLVWFNQDWPLERLKPGFTAAFSGRVRRAFGRLQMVNPSYDLLEEGGEPVHTGRLVPVHPATSRLSPPRVRRIVWRALNAFSRRIPDPLPRELSEKYGLPTLGDALWGIHFPSEPQAMERARARLVYEELLTLEVGLALKKKAEEEVEGIAHLPRGPLVDAFLRHLPFELTRAQRRAMEEIAQDMSRPRPMHRLLQGEVGSGKTAVAAFACALAVQGGYQAAVMAPTEVLAEQHHRVFSSLLQAGAPGENPSLFDPPEAPRIALLTSSLPPSKREEVRRAAAEGRVDVVVGTHALIQEGVGFARLGLVVIDEQHRFGVHQRVKLKEKGERPDVLIMTATPIPRTLALTLYGDLDVSILDELPPGRKPVKTLVFPSSEIGREKAFKLLLGEVEQGRRAYVVCPLVEESPDLEAKAVEEEAERLKSGLLRGLRVGLLHGRMRPQEKQATMEAFRKGEIQVLVATTVIEVGVDVPEATVMLVEDAERFGLSQLHQLRGRVGRGEAPGYFLLLADPKVPEAQRRLKAVARISDGFRLAEEDLRIRGEGELFGPRQSGVPDLKLARLVEDAEWVLRARRDAFELVERDPHLRSHPLLREAVARRFRGLDVSWLGHG